MLALKYCNSGCNCFQEFQNRKKLITFFKSIPMLHDQIMNNCAKFKLSTNTFKPLFLRPVPCFNL